MARFSQVATIYFVMGIVMVGSGVLPFAEVGIASIFIEEDQGGVAVDRDSVGGTEGDTGLLGNLIGPVKNALNTIAGGALIAIWAPVSKLAGFYAWPLTTASAIGAPWIVQAFSGVLVGSFTFGLFRTIRASV
jgi:hypothetical protein